MPVTDASAPATTVAPSELVCRACGGPTQPRFTARVLDHIDARYDECSECRSLQVAQPHWLEEAYARKYFPDPDQGALRRSLFLHRCIGRLRAKGIGWIPRHSRALDFGSGRGLLLRLLLDSGHDAWGYDPYPGAILAEDHVRRELPGGPQDLIVMAEVIEHLVDPDAVFSKLRPSLDDRGLLLISTELYDATRHGAGWHYLAPAHGQHIQFYSRRGLDVLLKKHGLTRVLSLKMDGIDFLHVYRTDSRRVATAAVSLQRLWHRLAEHRH